MSEIQNDRLKVHFAEKYKTILEQKSRTKLYTKTVCRQVPGSSKRLPASSGKFAGKL
jgi:hypothetical protein